MEKCLALKVDDRDNVATVFSEVKTGSEVTIQDKLGGIRKLISLSDIPYGHKIALVPMAPGDAIYKYGERIGVATKPVREGEYVHVHNLDSMRGRGDLRGEVE